MLQQFVKRNDFGRFLDANVEFIAIFMRKDEKGEGSGPWLSTMN